MGTELCTENNREGQRNSSRLEKDKRFDDWLYKEKITERPLGVFFKIISQGPFEEYSSNIREQASKYSERGEKK